jgi:predicted nucleic acid-binding protein
MMVKSDEVVFDSGILINLLNDKIDSHACWGTFRKLRRYISIVTEIEILSDRKLSDDEFLALKGFLKKEFLCIPFSRKIIKETIKFRRSCGHKLPDSFIAAAAVVHRLRLISNDGQLLKAAYPGLEVEAFALKAPASVIPRKP